MIDVMIDLETLGTNPNSPVLSIGAVAFNLSDYTLGKKFYSALGVQDQLNRGRAPSAATLAWWMGQTNDAKCVFKEDAVSPRAAIEGFTYFIKSLETDVRVWGKGPSFDITIMEDLFYQYEMEVPWKFWNIRCVRTILDFLPNPNFAKSGVAHNALDDAVNQANEVMAAVKEGKTWQS